MTWQISEWRGAVGRSPGGRARGGRLAVLAGVGAILAAACGSASTASPTASVAPQFNPADFNESGISWLKANVNRTGTPPSTPTGTLTIAGSNDVSGMLDPQGEYDTIGYSVLRATTRSLVGYPPSSNLAAAEAVVPDAAASYTVSADKTTYTFKVRPGMRWAVTNPSTGAAVAPDDGAPVTSQDFELGIERNCDPNFASYNNPAYYTATIKGFSDFCSKFSAMSTSSTPAQRKAFINSNPVSGLSTPDSSTLVVTLNAPASDFPNIMAMYFAAAAPPSSLNYIPLTAGNPIWSDGPYEVQNYTPGSKIALVPNPYWGSTSGTDTTSTSWSNDPTHHRYVAQISINETLGSAAAADEVQQEIEAGTLDLEWNTVVPDSSLPTLANHSNPGYGDFPAPGNTNPYLVFNLAKSGPLQNVKVRQALEYAVNKVAMGKIYGGAEFNSPLGQVFAVGAEGYIPGYDPYGTPKGDAGNAAECKTLLKKAGYASGFTITDYYRTDGNHPAVFQEIQRDFGACGVTVNGKGISKGYYTTSGIGAANVAGLQSAGWDITEPGWVPDWFGPTNARSILPDLFACSNFPGTNWGDFCNKNVDNLTNQAETAPTLSQSEKYWEQANRAVMEQAPFIPFQTQLTNLMHASAVHNAIYVPFSESYDYTQCWLGS
jgi:ABC-type transport system substrate-binding protein